MVLVLVFSRHLNLNPCGPPSARLRTRQLPQGSRAQQRQSNLQKKIYTDEKNGTRVTMMMSKGSRDLSESLCGRENEQSAGRVDSAVSCPAKRRAHTPNLSPLTTATKNPKPTLQPSVGERHHLPAHRRRLALRGRYPRPLQPPQVG